MRSTRIALIVGCAMLLAPAAFASGGGGSPLDLNILLTNDDGYDSPGITALRTALENAGHTVTIVAPAENQSGKGGSINTNVLDLAPGSPGLMLLIHHGGGIWSLEGTPADCVKAGLDIVMKNNPPDLVVSGLNFGQNIGKPGTNESGTIGAGLHGLFAGVPAIAGSVEQLVEENPTFDSTFAAFPQASEFIASVIDTLTKIYGNDVLPPQAQMLNINFPVPYEDIAGVKLTQLADGSDLALPLFDPSEGFPPFGVPPLPFPPCAAAAAGGGACFAAVGVLPTPDEPMWTDLGAYRAGNISITPISGNMTAWSLLLYSLQHLDP